MRDRSSTLIRAVSRHFDAGWIDWTVALSWAGSVNPDASASSSERNGAS
jgi:hypothetical protein